MALSATYKSANGACWGADLSLQPHSLCTTVKPKAGSNVSAFGLPPPATKDFCTVDAGASVNCAAVELTPHGNGTHTECVGHALPGSVTLADIPLPPLLLPTLVLTVVPRQLRSSEDSYAPGQADDLIVSSESIEDALNALRAKRPELDAGLFLHGGAIVIRTTPNDDSKRSKSWSGSNAPYFTPQAIHKLLAHDIRHLVCDLPSVDREDDGGNLLAHRAFWGLPPRGQPPPTDRASLSPRTITELAYVPDEVTDGPYFLSLQVAPIELDAAPSRPLLFPLLA